MFSKFWILALIGTDALTKALALQWIPPLNGSIFPFGGISIFENFWGVSCSLNYIANTGVAWGFFANYFSFLLILRVLVVIALCIYLFWIRSDKTPFWPLYLIVAGAVGNIIDMFFYSHVIDFIHFRFFGWSFPIFNFADSCITIGVLLLLIWPRKSQQEISDAH